MNTLERFRHITAQEFALLGLQDVAYIRALSVNDQLVYGIFAANGSQMGVLPDRDVAFAAVRQQDLEPVSVH